MDPKLASKLMSEVPEMREFIAFIKGEVRKLDTTLDINIDSPVELAVEVKGRKRALEVLSRILSPLINIQDLTMGDKDEYVV